MQKVWKSGSSKGKLERREKDDGMTPRTHVTNPEVKHWHGRRLMPQVEQVMLFQEGSGPQERRHSLDKV